jgi:hypothetical protein
MAHFAKINESNIVETVNVVNDTEAVSGQAFLNSLGLTGTWIQTSYNTRGNTHILSGTPLRGNYAGIGYIYDSVNDVFYPPQPYSSWSIGLSSNWIWVAPVPAPVDGNNYMWNESTLSWVIVPTLSGS